MRLGTVVVFVASVSTVLAAQAPQRVRVGGDIKRPLKVVHVDPLYPEQAKADQIEGLVILEAVISTNGTVADLDVIRSAHPLLDDAAVEAVSRWEYAPALLDGEPVELVLSVNVTFSLPRPEEGGPAVPAPPPPPPAPESEFSFRWIAGSDPAAITSPVVTNRPVTWSLLAHSSAAAASVERPRLPITGAIPG
jgi:TonB family protein